MIKKSNLEVSYRKDVLLSNRKTDGFPSAKSLCQKIPLATDQHVDLEFCKFFLLLIVLLQCLLLLQLY